MSVEFHEGTLPSTSQLWPVLRRANGSDWQILSAVTVRGIVLGISPADVKLWLWTQVMGLRPDGTAYAVRDLHGTDAEQSPTLAGLQPEWAQRFAPIVNSDRIWHDLVDAAEERASSSISLRGVARRIYARVLFPLRPDGTVGQLKRETNIRLVATLVGLWTMQGADDPEDLIDTVPVGIHQLVAFTGYTHNTADAALGAALSARVLTNPRTGNLSQRSIYRLVDRSESREAQLARYEDSIDSMIEGRPDGIAAVLLSALHPVWSYSGVLDWTHWLMLLVDVAGLEPSRFGIRDEKARKLRRALDLGEGRNLILLARGAGATLFPEVLNEIAEDLDAGRVRDGDRPLSPLEAWTRATEQYATRAERRWAETSGWLAEHKTSFDDGDAQDEAPVEAPDSSPDDERWDELAILNGILQLLPIPEAPKDDGSQDDIARIGRFQEWVEQMHSGIAASAPEAGFCQWAQWPLMQRLQESGYAPGLLPRIVQFILLAPAHVDLNEFMAAA